MFRTNANTISGAVDTRLTAANAIAAAELADEPASVGPSAAGGGGRRDYT